MTEWRILFVVLIMLIGRSAASMGQAADLDEQRSIDATVIHCLAGDFLSIQAKGRREHWTIRLIGVEAPVRADRDNDGQEPWGTQAQQWLTLKATRKRVRVEFDVREREPGNDALWAYVWLGDELLNAELLRNGHGVLATAPPNVAHAERLQVAQNEARENQRGIWNPARPLPESPSRFRSEMAERERIDRERIRALELPAFREGCVIGNRESKKFHVPGGRYYKQSKSSRNAVFFATEADAIRAGFEKAAR